MDGTRRDARRQSDAEPCQARFAPGEAGGIWVNRTFFSQRWPPLVSHPATRAVQVAERVRRAHRHRLSQRSQCDPPPRLMRPAANFDNANLAFAAHVGGLGLTTPASQPMPVMLLT